MRPPHSLLIQCRTGLPIWRDSNFREWREPGALPPRNAEKRQYQEVGQRRKMGKNGSDFKALMPIAAFFLSRENHEGPARVQNPARHGAFFLGSLATGGTDLR
jgi:hypothetical protein